MTRRNDRVPHQILICDLESDMPKVDKSAYNDKHKSLAKYLEDDYVGYIGNGVAVKKTKRRVWEMDSKSYGQARKHSSARAHY